MSLWTVVRRGRVAKGVVKEAADDEWACWMRVDVVAVVGRPVSPAAGSNSAGMGAGAGADADAEVLGLGCSLALFLRWRTLWCRLAMYWNGLEGGEK